MKKNGFEKITVPSGNGLMFRYKKNKTPYSSEISEDMLKKIIVEIVKGDFHLRND